jgi:3,4-dihydroxy 2-butanone 4-phosphate synthase/GTP cyclohydrolase II
MRVSPIPEILNDFKAGRFVILVDDQNRENEGDLMMAAEFVEGRHLNFMLQEARGLICLCLSDEQVRRLALPLQFSEQHSGGKNHAAFTYSIEASQGVTTGISARERAHTIQTAIKTQARPSDICCPGHVLPLRALPGGVLERPGHTEASVDLAILSGLRPAAVLCEVLDGQGEAADRSYLAEFSARHAIKIGAVADLIAYRERAR